MAAEFLEITTPQVSNIDITRAGQDVNLTIGGFY
jgi:hypothetical protein